MEPPPIISPPPTTISFFPSENNKDELKLTLDKSSKDQRRLPIPKTTNPFSLNQQFQPQPSKIPQPFPRIPPNVNITAPFAQHSTIIQPKQSDNPPSQQFPIETSIPHPDPNNNTIAPIVNSSIEQTSHIDVPPSKQIQPDNKNSKELLRNAQRELSIGPLVLNTQSIETSSAVEFQKNDAMNDIKGYLSIPGDAKLNTTSESNDTNPNFSSTNTSNQIKPEILAEISSEKSSFKKDIEEESVSQPQTKPSKAKLIEKVEYISEPMTIQYSYFELFLIYINILLFISILITCLFMYFVVMDLNKEIHSQVLEYCQVAEHHIYNIRDFMLKYFELNVSPILEEHVYPILFGKVIPTIVEIYHVYFDPYIKIMGEWLQTNFNIFIYPYIEVIANKFKEWLYDIYMPCVYEQCA